MTPLNARPLTPEPSTVMSVVRSILPASFGKPRLNKDDAETAASRAHEAEIATASRTCLKIIESIENVVFGKRLQIRQSLACVLANGHLLIEDVPGVGKTTLANALATALGLRYNRMQFTSDMMPADIVGGSVYDRESQAFVFHPGPIFAQVLLADEINRASPKTQSALLEAMAEGQVSIDGATHRLSNPFFVLATQNPAHQLGTFGLPESQMDRFLMSISMGYPDEVSEKRMLMTGKHHRTGLVQAAVDVEQVIRLQALASSVSVGPAVADYAWRAVHASRNDGAFVDGLSPRAGMAWMRAAQAWALIDGRAWVMPDDLQATFVQCSAHRLQLKLSRQTGRDIASQNLTSWLSGIHVEGTAG